VAATNPSFATYRPEESKRLFQLREASIAENARVEALRAEVEAARAALRPPAAEPETFAPSGIAAERIERMKAYRAVRRGRRRQAAARA